MSRVEEQQKHAQAEAERLQKQADRASRDAKRSDEARNRFGELVKQGQGQDQAMTKLAQKSQGEQVLAQHVQGEQAAARMARLARGGTLQHGRILEQVKSFQGTLETQKGTTEEADKGRVERREDGLAEARSHHEERVSDLDRKKEARAETERDLLKAEAREKARANAAIDAGGQHKGGSSSEGEATADPNAVKGVGAAGTGQAAEAQAAHEVKQIPEAILEALANEVYVGINEKGLAEFRVELKEGILQGATLRVTADGGKIQLAFEGLAGNAKRLVQASEGDIAKRLRAKGLILDEIRV